MSTLIGDRLPTPVLDALGVEGRDRADGQCLPLITVDAEGRPRPCLLSVGEILVVSDQCLRIAVWPNSNTTKNLDRGGQVVMTVVAPPDAYHLYARSRRLPDAPASALARFELTITDVEADEHEGMPITHPMWFAARADLTDKIITIWREQLHVLQY